MPPIAVGDPAQRVRMDGRTRYTFLEDVDGAMAVESLVAVTTTELATGHDLSRYTPKDGWQGTPTFNKVPNTDVTETFDAEDQGTWGFSPTWQLYIQHPDNNAFDLFAPGGLTGVLLHFYALDLNTAPAEGDPYYAYRLRTAIPVPIPAASNENQRFSLDPALLQAPVYDGVLVSGA